MTAPLAARLAALKAASEGATEGRWRWIVNRKMREVALAGAKDVMRFSRWGMREAAPMFLDATGNYCRIDDFIVPIVGREHHAAWHATIDHPDARHIAAFPPAVTRALIDAAAALGAIMALAERNAPGDGTNWTEIAFGDPEVSDALAALASLDRATGGGGE